MTFIGGRTGNTRVNELPHNELGHVFMKINETSLDNIVSIKNQLQIIYDILSLPNNSSTADENLSTYETFIECGCHLVKRFILANVYIEELENLLNSMKAYYNYLPVSSCTCCISLFSKNDLKSMFSQFQKHFDYAPKLYLSIFTQIWTFCKSEIIYDDLVEMILKIVIGKVIEPSFDPFLKNLFEYCGFIIQIYVEILGDKMNNILVINKCIQLLEVIVRTKSHAIARLQFWWQFICSMKGETLMLTPCIVPFLANLFGKYVTLNQEDKYAYDLSSFNCFNNKTELAPLCHFVMRQLLQAVTGSIVSGLPKITVTYDTFDINIFKENYKLESFIEPLIVAFYFWFQLIANLKIYRPFDLFQVVFDSFANRFISSCDYKLNELRSGVRPDDVNPTLFQIVQRCILIKNLLENDLDPESRLPKLIFSDHLKIIRSVIDSLARVSFDLSIIPRGRDIVKCLLFDNLSLIKIVCLKCADESNGIPDDLLEQWLTNSKDLIQMLLPDASAIEQGFMVREIGEINSHWCGYNMNDDFSKIIRYNNIWSVNIKLWCFISSKLSSEFNKSSFTLNYIRNCEELKPFFEYLMAPILFFNQSCFDSMDKEDFVYICKVHEELYHSFVTKASFVSAISANDLCHHICLFLLDCLKNVDPKSCLLHTLINFVPRVLCHVMYYCVPIGMVPTTKRFENVFQVNDGLLAEIFIHSFINVVIKTYQMLDASNFRITLKVSSPRRRIFLQEQSFLNKRIPTAFQKSLTNSDPMFTLGLILSTTERLLPKLSGNQRLVSRVWNKLSPLIVKEIIIFLSKVITNEKKDSAVLKGDMMEVEKFIIFFLKSNENSCKTEQKFAVLFPLFSKLFSFKGDISRQLMKFVVQYWNNHVHTNATKYQSIFSNTFIKHLTRIKTYYPSLMLPSPRDGIFETFSSVLKDNTQLPNVESKVNNSGRKVSVHSKENINKGTSSKPIKRLVSINEFKSKDRPPKRQHFLQSSKSIDKVFNCNQSSTSKSQSLYKTVFAPRICNRNADLDDDMLVNLDDVKSDTTDSTEQMIDNKLPSVVVEDIRATSKIIEVAQMDVPVVGISGITPKTVENDPPIELTVVKRCKLECTNDYICVDGQFLPTQEKSVCSPLRENNTWHHNQNENIPKSSIAILYPNEDKSTQTGIMRDIFHQNKKRSRVSFSDPLVHEENIWDTDLHCSPPVTNDDGSAEAIFDPKTSSTEDSTDFQTTWSTVLRVLGGFSNEQKVKYLHDIAELFR